MAGGRATLGRPPWIPKDVIDTYANLPAPTFRARGTRYFVLDNGLILFQNDGVWARMGSFAPYFEKVSTTTADGAVDGTSLVDVMDIDYPSALTKVGSFWRLKCGGTADAPSDASPTAFTVKLNLPGASLTLSPIPTASSAVTNKAWDAEINFVCQTVGAGGSVKGNGKLISEMNTAFALGCSSKYGVMGMDTTTATWRMRLQIAAAKAVASWVIRCEWATLEVVRV